MSESTPNELIEEHQPLVISIASRIYKRLPRFISYEDVLSYGQLGLAQAARTYQPSPEAKFATFAYYRISGAIYDGITKMNWSSRSGYRNARAQQSANDLLEEEGATKLEDEESSARWFVDSVESLSTVFLYSSANSDSTLENQIEGTGVAPDEATETRELVSLLQDALYTLDDECRRLIELSYFEGHSLAEASRQLGKSRSWGSRTHAEVLKVLSRQLVGFEIEES